MTDNAPDVMFTIASNAPVHLGIGKDSVTSKPSKVFPYVPAAFTARRGDSPFVSESLTTPNAPGGFACYALNVSGLLDRSHEAEARGRT